MVGQSYRAAEYHGDDFSTACSTASFVRGKGGRDPSTQRCALRCIQNEAHPLFNDYIYVSARSCLYAFDGDDFYHVLDSLGGP